MPPPKKKKDVLLISEMKFFRFFGQNALYLAFGVAQCMKWYLNPVVVSVGHDDILVPAQAEPVGRVELTLGLTQLTELGPHLHRPHARHQSVGCVGHPQDPGVGVLAQTTLVHLQTGQATAAKSAVGLYY